MTDRAGPGESQAQRMEIHGRRGDIDVCTQRIIDAIDAHGYEQAQSFSIRLALEEALSNAWQHGHRGRETPPIEVQWRVDPHVVEIDVRDRGTGFDPNVIPDPTARENIEIPSGRGSH
jgi:serine/threonine-protein kinase RsbW